MNRRRFLKSAGAAAMAGPLALRAERSAVQAEIHVSTSGDDVNAGAPAVPVRTLTRALQLSRERKQKSGIPACILLRPGIYELAQTLSLTSEDAGTAEHPLRIEAPGDGEVVLSGGSRLHLRWTPYRDAIYQAAVPAGTRTDQLFINGKRQILARYPNFDEHARYLNGTATEAQLKERSQRWKRPEGAYLNGLQASLWAAFTIA